MGRSVVPAEPGQVGGPARPRRGLGPDAHAALGDSFVIIQWPDETDPEAVYVDGVTSWTVHERGGVIRSYLHAVASVQSQALAPRESLDLIHDVIKDLQ
ncbi:MAG: Scr1 family TA system antitoxin-like transcriptional regulator [Pseudonocardiaceae bacterium]